MLWHGLSLRFMFCRVGAQAALCGAGVAGLDPGSCSGLMDAMLQSGTLCVGLQCRGVEPSAPADRGRWRIREWGLQKSTCCPGHSGTASATGSLSGK